MAEPSSRLHDKKGYPSEYPFFVAGSGGAAVRPSAAPAAGDHVVQRFVEGLLAEQLLEREVHPVAPVVAGDGRDVDASSLYIRGGPFYIHREPVL